MRFTIEVKAFASVLTSLFRVIPSRSASPAIENYLIEADPSGTVRVTASDLETTLRSVLRVGEAGSVSGAGSCLLPARILLEVVRAVNTDTLTVSANGSSAEVAWTGGKAAIPAFDADDYPDTMKPLDPDRLVSLALDASALLRGVSATVYAAADDAVRPNIQGIFFDAGSKDGLTLVATDTRRMACHIIPSCIPEKDGSFILPKRDALLLKSLLPNDEDVTVTLGFDDRNATFSFGDTVVSVRNVVGKYPKWRSVVPTADSNPGTLTMPRADLASLIRRISVCASKSSPAIKMLAVLDATGGGLTIDANDFGFGVSASETVQADYKGEEIAITFKAPFVIEALASLSCEKVALRFRSPRHAVLLEPADVKMDCGDRSFSVLMPIMG